VIDLEDAIKFFNVLSQNSWFVTFGAVAWSSLTFWFFDKKIHFRDLEKQAIEDSNRKSVHRLDELLHTAKSMSMRRVRVYIKNLKKVDKCEQSTLGTDCLRTESYWDTMEKQMMLALNSSLFGAVRASVKYKIYNNGYHGLEGVELLEYCKVLGEEAIEESRGVLADITSGTPLAEIADEDRFTVAEAIELATKLIESSNRYYRDALRDVEKEKDGYKIPFLNKRVFK
jgi:hypothetical protein